MFKSMEKKLKNSRFIPVLNEYAKNNLEFTDCLMYYSYLISKEKKYGLTVCENSMLYDSVHNCEDELFKAFNLDYKYASEYDSEANFSIKNVAMEGINEILRISGLDKIEISPQYVADYIGSYIAEYLDKIFEEDEMVCIVPYDYYFGKIETSEGTVIKTLYFFHEGLISDVITGYNSEITARRSFYDALLKEGLPKIMRRLSYMEIIFELVKDIWFTQFENENWDYLKYFPVLRRILFQYAETNFYLLLSYASTFNAISEDIYSYYDKNPSDYDKADYSGKIHLYDEFDI